MQLMPGHNVFQIGSILFGHGLSNEIVLPPFAVEGADGEPVITVGEGGNMSVTIGSGPYAGTYTQRATDSATLTAAMVQAAPTAIALPVITGTLTEGEVVTLTPGLWLYAGDDPGDQTFAWVNNVDGATGITATSYTLQASDVGDTIKVSETFGGVTVDSADTAAISAAVAPGPAFAVTEVVQTQDRTAAGPPAEFGTVDLSAYPAGTQILILTGQGRLATMATVDGVVATEVAPGAVYGGNIYANAFVATLTSQGTAAAPISVMQTTVSIIQMVSVYAIEGGVIDGGQADGAGGGGADLTVTPSAANNVILAMNGINDGNVSVTTTWSGNITETFDGIAGFRSTSLARADDVPVAPFNVTATNSVAKGWGAVLVSISEAP